jgi:hypothetical protein
MIDITITVITVITAISMNTVITKVIVIDEAVCLHLNERDPTQPNYFR